MAKEEAQSAKVEMTQKVKAKSRKVGKKGFYDVKAPLISTKISLYGASVEEFEGKTVKIDLTRNLKGKSLELRLRVSAKDGELNASPISLNLMNSYIRKVIRNGTDYVEDSFGGECKDTKVRIKPFLITRNRVSRAVMRALRNNAKSFLEGYLKTRSSEEIFSEILSNKLQKLLFAKLKKVYPLALCEIRAFEVEK